MFAFGGQTSSSTSITITDLPVKIISFSLVDRSGATNTVNVQISNTNTCLIPFDLQLGSHALYESSRVIFLEVGHILQVSSSGTLDFYFTLDNVDV